MGETATETPQVRSNKKLDFWMMTSHLEMELSFALQQLSNYLQDLQLLEAGARYADLGIGKRREASRPGIIRMSNNGPITVQDPAMLNDLSRTPKGAFAHLRLQGAMRSQDGASSQGINSLADNIHTALQNDRIEGILIEANTGGGEGTAGTILKAAIEQSTKPVVVFAHQLASAGVKGTLPADEIIASGESARIGSIGTYLSISKGFKDWYNRNYTDTYADKSTNKNKDFRAFLEGDMSELIKQLNENNELFLKEVQKYRPLRGDIENTLSGELFLARKAKSRGLIDGIGSFQYAVNRLSKHAKKRKNQ